MQCTWATCVLPPSSVHSSSSTPSAGLTSSKHHVRARAREVSPVRQKFNDRVSSLLLLLMTLIQDIIGAGDEIILWSHSGSNKKTLLSYFFSSFYCFRRESTPTILSDGTQTRNEPGLRKIILPSGLTLINVVGRFSPLCARARARARINTTKAS